MTRLFIYLFYFMLNYVNYVAAGFINKLKTIPVKTVV